MKIIEPSDNRYNGNCYEHFGVGEVLERADMVPPKNNRLYLSVTECKLANIRTGTLIVPPPLTRWVRRDDYVLAHVSCLKEEFRP